MLKITLNACNPIYLRAMNHKELSISKILICATLSLYLLRLMPVSTVKSRGSQSSLLPFAVAVCVALKI